MEILNYTNSNMHKGWIGDFFPIGEQRVMMTLPDGRKVSRVELLRAEKETGFSQKGNTVTFLVPSIIDYEVAALYSA
jgi:hypothetical protein